MSLESNHRVDQADPWLSRGTLPDAADHYWRDADPVSSTLTYATVTVLALMAAISTWLAVAHVQRAALGAATFAPGSAVTAAAIGAADRQLQVASIAYYNVLMGAAALFVAWLYHVVRLVVRYRPDALRYAPGWAIGGWFVPILFLFRPKQMVDDAWRGSEPTVGVAAGVPWYVHAWWAAWLLGLAVTAVARQVLAGDIRSAVVADRVAAAGWALHVCAACLAILLVLRLTDRVRRKASRAALGEASRSGPSTATVVAATALGVVLIAGVAAAVGPQAPARTAATSTPYGDRSVPSRAAPAVPAGFKQLADGTDSVTVDVPRSWASLPTDPQRLSAALAALGRRDPGLAVTLPHPERDRLLALDPSSAHLMTVRVVDGPGVSPNDIRQALTDKILQSYHQQHFTVRANDVVNVAGLSALRFRIGVPLLSDETRLGPTTQYWVLASAHIFVITISAPDALADRISGTFQVAG